MTKSAALYNFWAGFGLPAYEENTLFAINKNPDMPYITYEQITDSFGNYTVSLTASVWFRSSSWAEADAKAEEISAFIGRGGHFINCDGGCVWIKRRSPFAQNLGGFSDELLKRKVLNISVEFFTEN